MKLKIVIVGLFFLSTCLVSVNLFSQTKINIVCIGNSITEGATPTLNYPYFLSGHMGIKYKVYNLGKSGSTLRFSPSNAWIKYTYLTDSLKKIKPKIVMIKLGTNDAGVGLTLGPVYEADYLKLIDSVLKWSDPAVKIYLCTPIPIFNNATSDMVIDTVMIPIIKKIAIQKSCKLIDLNTAFDGRPELVIADGVHPSADGFMLIAKTVFDSIKTLVSSIQVSVDTALTAINGGVLNLKAVVDAEATNVNVTWTSENITGKASINSIGKISPLENGTVKFIATAKDGSGVKGELVVTIKMLSSITVVTEGGVNASITENKGTLQLKANVDSSATNYAVTWSIVNIDGKASITSTGKVTASANGTVKAIATAKDGSGTKAELLISISNQSAGVNKPSVINYLLYPNPAKDYFIISGDVEKCTVEIYNMIGNKIFEEYASEMNQKIDISTLSQGMYFVKLTNEGSSACIRLMKE